MTGKQVASRIYVHLELFDELDDGLREQIAQALEIARIIPSSDFNVARIDPIREEVGLLNYPDFFGDPFPALTTAWRVHLPTKAITFRDYRGSLNPPILHRKELLLPASHPTRAALVRLTTQAESIGLFDDPVRIGFRNQWRQLIASKGYMLDGDQFVAIGNASIPEQEFDGPGLIDGIARHRTALSRSFLSAPVQALVRLGVLRLDDTFFDYGCGRGDDILGLASLGYKSAGWDPHFFPNRDRLPSDVVNIGFVINVIEDMSERVAALRGAYDLSGRALAVAAMLANSSTPSGKKYADGVLTSKHTFQRYYSQAELQAFIEAVLDEHAHPVGPGIFFVFKDRYLEQRFLVGRLTDPTRAPRLLTTRGRTLPCRLPALRPPAPESPEQLAALQQLWETALSLGRLPDAEEYSDAGEVIKYIGSWNRALRQLLARFDSAALTAAADSRRDELRVLFAHQALRGRKLRGALEPQLRRDVRVFFGSLTVAETEGLALLKSAADPLAIGKACEDAASNGLGFLDNEHSLQLHSSMINRLPPILRAYVGSATVLLGDLSGIDLVKIHIQSGKVTLMIFDDFGGSPVPKLIERIKVKLREQDLDYFEYGGEFAPPLLYFKSRFINEEFPYFPQQLAFDEALARTHIVPSTGYGPSEMEFTELLRRKRLKVDGWRIGPSTDIPSPDSRCGATFTYRQLIECGQTWTKTKVDNRPRSAATYNALCELATKVLDPVVDYFGGIEITYGFASTRLTKHIPKGIAPRLDQHASCEVNNRDGLVCARRGAAVDFLVRDEDMREVVRWIRDNCHFDRLYFYGKNRPIHVSVGPEMAGEMYEIVDSNGRRMPRVLVV